MSIAANGGASSRGADSSGAIAGCIRNTAGATIAAGERKVANRRIAGART